MKGGTMKHALIGAALLVSFASPAAAFTLWQGDMFLTAVNNATACTAVNAKVGDFARGVFRPRNVSDNGVNDLLSLVFARSAMQVVPNGGNLDGAVAGTLRTIYASAGFQELVNDPLSATVAPTAPTTATPTIAIVVTINNVFSKNPATLSNCHATYRGTLAKRPI
jgi:hypothetical protein